MDVNEIQIGGDHYQKHHVQHWDMVLAGKLSYLQGNATKYLGRYKDKNGLQDLRKASHYIWKMDEHPPWWIIRVLRAWWAMRDPTVQAWLEQVKQSSILASQACEAVIYGHTILASNLIDMITEEEYGVIDSGKPQGRGYVDQD